MPDIHADAKASANEELLRGRIGSIPEAGMFGRAVDRVSIVFAIGILVGMAVLVLEVVLRYVFNSPTIWAHETTTFLSAVTFVFGGLYCVARNSHIRVVLVYDHIRGRARILLDAVISLVCFAASAMFTWAAWITLKKAMFRPSGEFAFETSGSAWNAPTPGLLKLMLFLVLILMSAQFLVLAFNYLRAFRATPGPTDR